MRESAETKSRRLLAEGRLIVVRLNGNRIHAICRGDGAVHTLTVDGDDWNCTCPARGRCSHLLALGKVTATNRVPT